MNQHKTKYLQDYKPPAYLIDKVNLFIELGVDETRVTSQLSVRANPKIERLVKRCVLEGEDQRLISIKLDGELLNSSQYELDDQSLTLVEVPAEFLLEIQTAIKPQENIALSGLYKTNNIFCTQCESEGFRRITYFMDRPDILSKYTTTIAADKHAHPVLLSNGELVDSGDMSNNMHWFKWEDPHPKPCYLFAMVAGTLDFIEDYFETVSSRKVTLRIFCEPGDREKCRYAMSSLKKAMRWDEEKYGREYDLSLFMIVAVHDFNFGAMENKGLNIFNTKYILVNPETATDTDYKNVDRVVGHEYFHNWSGNRVTCRDWFQICLKEGFTVFRDQTFVEDTGSRAVNRIEEVEVLRDSQFPEDAGPLAHPICPESYIEINNFYTMTVYRKGAEVIRMLQTLLGEENFRRGSDLYFERHDGYAVMCEDFIKAMEDANQRDLSQFRLWYQQVGTPTLYLASKYYPEEREWHLAVSQNIPPTQGQAAKKTMQIPVAMGLLDRSGQDMALQLTEEKNSVIGTKILTLTKDEELFVFIHINEKPVPSFLRGFSAPVKMEYQYRDSELAFLMLNDTDAFSRWEAAQQYVLRALNVAIKSLRIGSGPKVCDDFYDAFSSVLKNQEVDRALIAKMFELPSEQTLGIKQAHIAVDLNHAARKFMLRSLARRLHEQFLATYQKNNVEKPYAYHVTDSARRQLKNICLHYLTQLETAEAYALCVKQFESADNMTDRWAAITAMNDHDCPERTCLLEKFYQDWNHDPLVMDKWFTLQALSSLPNTFNHVADLTHHSKFNLKNPNRVYALLGNFSRQNLVCFHASSGAGYRLLADKIIEIDAFNSQVAARLLEPLTQWKRYDVVRAGLMQDELKRILDHAKLSKAVYEIASKSVSQ